MQSKFLKLILILQKYIQFKYILFDEYQDTNLYSEWLKYLSEKTKIFVVLVMMTSPYIAGEALRLKIF